MEEKTLTPEEKEEAVESEEPCCPEEAEVESGAEAESEVEEKAETEEEEAETEEAEEQPPTVPVTFSWRPPIPEKVFIAGTFNNWNPSSHELTRSETGEWQMTLDLAPGIYEYRLVIDGEWITDPACEEKVANRLGSYNSVLTVE